jgi:GNAT superfamily N-acetyltransferase
MNERTIRRARPDEARVLTDLTYRSKAHWGYDEAFMTQYRAALTISPDEVRDNPVYLLEQDERIGGYYVLQYPDAETAVLDSLFVNPDTIRSGVGRALWLHALETAAALGCRVMRFDSDPHAEGFYLKMGARRIGEKPAPQPGEPDRVLPVMEFELRTPGPAP